VTGLTLVVVLGFVLLAGRVFAARLRLAPPLFQLICGVLIGFLPVLREVHLEPEVVLLLFLPVLLYWESLTTGLRTVLANLRVVVLLATTLVAVTAGAIAVVGHLFGLPWGPAWVLGGALAPTDATAAAVLTRSLPKRMVTTLRAESLVNDGTALVIYGVAVQATVGSERVGALHVSGLLALSYVGGVASGLVVAYLSNEARRRLHDSLASNLNSLLSPFAAFLLAEVLHASGILAVVTCGLVALRKAPRYSRPEARRQRDAFWTLATYILNGALFVLVGMEAHAAVRVFSGAALAQGLLIVVAVTAVTIGVRFGWLFTTPYLIRAVDRRPQQRRLRMSGRARLVYVVAGFRGAVSLAAALAVPQTIGSGPPFPDRDLIVFVTAGVIVMTLAQALVLPAVIRWADLPPDHSDAQERASTRTAMLTDTLEHLDELAASSGAEQEVADRVRRRYQRQLRVHEAGHDDPTSVDHRHYAALVVAALHHERDVLLRLRDEKRIDDDTVVDLQSRLDLDELRYHPPVDGEEA
jgi:Na+/H+ antiporter